MVDPDERDEAVRVACFLALDALRARSGEDLRWQDLQPGFTFGGRRVPFKHLVQGIYRWDGQRGPAALSIATSARNPYGDEETDGGLWYAFDGRDDAANNRWLRAAYELGVPLVYFDSTRPSWWRAMYPCFVAEVDRAARRVFITVGERQRAYGELAPPSAIERRYTFREARVRLHQGRFRATVLAAYRDQCTICRLKEPRLLDAAHILPDASERGIASATNGLSLCSIHHRAFDQNLLGVDPEYVVHVSRTLLDEDDGPMLDLLKRAHQQRIEVPRRVDARPDVAGLAARFAQFRAA